MTKKKHFSKIKTKLKLKFLQFASKTKSAVLLTSHKAHKLECKLDYMISIKRHNPTNYRITVSAIMHSMYLKFVLKKLNLKRGIIFRQKLQVNS